MASHASRAAAVARQVKPMMSNNPEAARRRVIQLYKAWYREIPETGENPSTDDGRGGVKPLLG